MAFKKRTSPEEMTEEQRLYHEQYVAELTEQNRRTVSRVCTVLWCLAMVCWLVLLVLDVVFSVGAVKIVFHAVGAVLTALLSLRRVKAFFAARKEKNERTDA